MVTKTPWSIRTFAPVAVTALLIVWTCVVSPYSKYGDMWAIVSALLALPLVAGLHLLSAYKEGWSKRVVIYALIHCVLFFVIWIGCLTVISKDSL
jgi:hypothetical protein